MKEPRKDYVVITDTTGITAGRTDATSPYKQSAITNVGDTDHTIFSGDYDPADPVDAAAVNSGLKRHGYCLILNDGNVDLRDRNRYCEDPIGFAYNKGWKAGRHTMQTGSQSDGYVSYSNGILYRPRLSYLLYVFKKKNRKVWGGWRLTAQYTVNLANLSPMMSVGVKRTLFSSRNTVVDFDRGSLYKIAVAKRSELSSAVTIPLAVVKGVVELPTQIFQLRIQQTTDLGALADAQSRLLDAELKELVLLDELAKVRSGANDTSTNTPDPVPPTTPAGG